MITFISIVFILILLNRLVYINHPISLGFILIFYALATGMLFIILRESWFFYLLVSVLLSGVIILIIYISTSLADEKFFLDNGGLPVYMLVLFLSFTLIFYFKFNNRRIKLFCLEVESLYLNCVGYYLSLIIFIKGVYYKIFLSRTLLVYVYQVSSSFLIRGLIFLYLSIILPHLFF